MEMPNNSELLREEAHNNALREALLELYKLQIAGEDVKLAIEAIEKLLLR